MNKLLFTIFGFFILISINSCDKSYSQEEYKDAEEQLQGRIDNDTYWVWKYSESKDPMDDSFTYSVRRYSNKSKDLRLNILCHDKQLEVIVSGEKIISNSDGDVELRLDDQKSFKQKWKVSIDGRSLLSKDPKAFIAQIQTAKKLRLQYLAYTSNEFLEFNLEGLIEPLNKVFSKCT